MAIIVEDGSIVENANSYVSVAELSAYAEARGVTLPTGGDAALEAAILRAMDNIELRSFVGSRTDATQPLSWPRQGVAIDGLALDAHTIPGNLKIAEFALALAVLDGISLNPNQSTRLVKRQKVGPIEREFEAGSGAAGSPVISIAEMALASLLDYPVGMEIRTVRV